MTPARAATAAAGGRPVTGRRPRGGGGGPPGRGRPPAGREGQTDPGRHRERRRGTAAREHPGGGDRACRVERTERVNGEHTEQGEAPCHIDPHDSRHGMLRGVRNRHENSPEGSTAEYRPLFSTRRKIMTKNPRVSGVPEEREVPRGTE